MIKKIIWFLLINAFALFVVSYFLGTENFSVTSANNTDVSNFIAFIAVGFTLGVLNAIVRPILALISLPFVIITFGLFLTLINAFLLWITEFLFSDIFSTFGIVFQIGGSDSNIISYIIGAICLSLINSILHFFGK